MLNKYAIYKRVAVSFLNTAATFLFLSLFLCLIGFVVYRIGGARIIYPILLILSCIGLVTFFLSEIIVNIILNAKTPDPEQHRDFIDGMQELCKQAAVIYQPCPRLRIMEKSSPNACAYGIGFLGQYSVAITQSLYDMLSRDELKAVLAHELAHIRCKDTGVLSMMNILSNGGKTLSLWMLSGALGPIGYVFGGVIYSFSKIIFPFGLSAISVQREYAADALGSLYHGNPDDLKSALIKISGVGSTESSMFDDMFVSHPSMANRIEALNSYLK